MNKIALITGTGMDARAITRLLLSKSYHVFVVSRRNTAFEFNKFEKLFDSYIANYPNSSLSVLYADVSDASSVENCIKVILSQVDNLHEIYHLAATSHVGYSYDTPVLNIQTNGMSAFYFLDSITKYTPSTKFYFASTTEMFAGNLEDERYTENSKFHPKTPYGCSKCLGFYWTQYFRETYGTFAVSGILANHSNFDRHNSFFIKKLTQGVAKIVTGKEKELRIGHLNWARDEFWADFGMEAAWKMLQLDKPMDFIVGNGHTRWGEEYVELAFNYFNLNWQDYIVFDEQFLRKNEVIKLEVNPLLAIDCLSWRPNRMPFKDHIELMCEYDYQLESGLNLERVNIFELYP